MRSLFTADILLEHAPLNPNLPDLPDFTYIPTLWTRIFESGIPDGWVSVMKDVQRESNYRRAKLIYNLNSFRAVVDADDHETSRLGRGVVARLDGDVAVADRLLQRLRARLRCGFGRQVDAHAVQHRVQRLRIGAARHAIDDRFGQQELARDAGERQLRRLDRHPLPGQRAQHPHGQLSGFERRARDGPDQAGGNLAALQHILGHRDLTTTMRYARVTDAFVEQEAWRVVFVLDADGVITHTQRGVITSDEQLRGLVQEHLGVTVPS